MFDIGFPELVLVCLVALLVLGPERMPQALRTLGLWMGRMRRSFVAVKTEIEREIGMDEVRRQLHNETILEDLKRLEREVRIDKPAQSTTASAATPGSPSPAPTDAPAASTEESTPRPNGTAG